MERGGAQRCQMARAWPRAAQHIFIDNKKICNSSETMSNLIAIRKRINSIASTIRVTKVMQMIATAKIAKIKQMMTVVGRYESETNDILTRYMNNTEMAGELKKYFSGFSTKKNVLLLLFSSDKGTCGSINTNIFKEASHEIA